MDINAQFRSLKSLCRIFDPEMFLCRGCRQWWNTLHGTPLSIDFIALPLVSIEFF